MTDVVVVATIRPLPEHRAEVIAALEKAKGSDPRKLALADLLWRHCTVSQGWLAEHLHMRSAANVSQQLRRFDIRKHRAKLPPALQRFLEKTLSSTKATTA